MFSGISRRYLIAILGLNALIVGVLLGAFEVQIKAAAQRKAQIDLVTIGKSYGGQLALRIKAQMQKDSLYGTPDRRLVSALAEELAGEASFRVTVFTSPATGGPVYTNLLGNLSDSLTTLSATLESKTEPFTHTMAGRDYISYVVPLLTPEEMGVRRPDYNVLVQRDEANTMVVYTTARQWLLAVGAGGMLASALLAFFLARSVTMPMKRIRETVVMVEKGEKPSPMTVSGSGEIAELVRAVNSLVQGPSAKDKVHQQAHTDPLTGLANRRALVTALDDVMQKGFRGKKDVSLMFLDLDGFKPINDTYGHEVGDEVLKTVAKRLGACVRDNDVICRLGGDEFVLMFPGLVDRDSIKQRADMVLEQINEPYWVGDSRVTMGVSIGIAIAPQDGNDGESLLHSSDEAMYVAKKQGKNQYAFYS